MNPVTFNDRFKDSVVASEGRDKWDRRIANSPLIYYSFSIDEVQGKLTTYSDKLNEDLDIPPFPFPCFRGEFHPLDPTEKGKKSTLAHFKIIMVSENDYSGAMMYVRPSNLLNDKDLPVLMFPVRGSFDDNQVYGFRRGKWESIRIASYEGSKDNFTGFRGREMYECALKSVFSFCADALVPNNHMVAVSPSDTKRSVEWRKARTHYTLITHGHPANNPNLKHGSTVDSDSNGELTRMAHNRRAHYRTLHSNRFRFAKGKRIFVRSAWVGPKEWKAEGGKQIYKILEPVI